MIKKENLTDNINASSPPDIGSNCTKNQVFNLQDPLDTMPISKIEIENIFVPIIEELTLELLQKYQNLDPDQKKNKILAQI